MMSRAMDTPSGDRLRLKDLLGRPPLTRSIPESKLLRLAQVAELGSSAQVELVVNTDASGRHWLEGTAVVSAQPECQRCLEPVVTTVKAQFRLWLLSERAEARLKATNLEVLQEHDVRLIADGMIDLVALVEDELLLELPEQPCLEASCPRMPALTFPADADQLADAVQESEGAPSTQRPFSGLKALLTDAAKEPQDD